jgi:hypothetical protein
MPCGSIPKDSISFTRISGFTFPLPFGTSANEFHAGGTTSEFRLPVCGNERTVATPTRDDLSHILCKFFMKSTRDDHAYDLVL